jgi:SpoVK/Ycf46/Vps4 family AAA+-type ATPase
VQKSYLADDTVSGGLSGAEIVSACRNAALMALEEDNSLESFSAGPTIHMHHLEHALTNAERQITKDMLDFYASF